jgi:hypothetical protein
VVVALIHPNRDPLYTVTELAELVRAIDARLRGCAIAICP